MSVDHLRYRSFRFLSVYLIQRRRTFPFWTDPFARTPRSSRCVRFTHQRVPIRRVPSRSFFTLRSARSARNESLCPSTYQLERSVARRKVFGIRIDDSKHRTRCCFPFDLFTRQRSTAGINRPLSVRRINISRTPACTLPSSISFVRSYERFEPKGNERPRSILFRFFEKFCPSTRCSFDGSEERKKKKNYRQTTCHDTSMSRFSGSVCRIALAPFIPPFLSSFHRVAYQPVPVCSCPRMQRSRPVKGNATI